MKYKVAIVDDEPRAHKIIEAYISRLPEIELAGTFLNAVTAFDFFNRNKIDVVFLDITMPELDGFTFLRMLKKPPIVIFTTAHSEFALESYDYDAVDYLKKPIPYERFVKAVNKAVSLIVSKEPTKQLLDHIDLRIDGHMKAISFNEITYFQSLGNYIKIITTEKMLVTQMTTAEIEATLPRELFIRIHKSFIVNRSRIEKVSDDEIIAGNIKLPIGKTFKKYVKDSVDNIDLQS